MNNLENGSNGSNKALGEGNTKLRPSSAKSWCFTYNNYSETDLAPMCTEFNVLGEYIFAKEVGESGTPHLQGYIKSKKKIRPIEYFRKWPKIHWEKCKGTHKQNIEYCTKDKGETFTNIKFPKPIYDIIADKGPNDFQKRILDYIKIDKYEDRKIIWVYDPKGSLGKTCLARHLCLNYNCLYVNGKGADIKYAVCEWLEKNNEIDICLFAFPRSYEDYNIYGPIEELKDGIFFSGKYEAKMKIFNPPKVIILCNFEPDLKALTANRWDVWDYSRPA